MRKVYYIFLLSVFLYSFSVFSQDAHIKKKNNYEYLFFSDDINIKVTEKRINDSLEVTIKFSNYKTVPVYIDTLHPHIGSGRLSGSNQLAWTINFFKLTSGLGNYGSYWHLQEIKPNQSFTYKCKISGDTEYQSFEFGYFDNLKLLKKTYSREEKGIKINVGRYYEIIDLDIGTYWEYGKKSIQKYMSYSIMLE